MKSNDNDITFAAQTLLSGGLVAMPTETVYGLAADSTNDKSVARIFEAKGRPQFNPLIIHVSGADMAKRYVSFSPLAETLASAFWPGPLTLVLPRRTEVSGDSELSLLVSTGLDTVGVRMPNHPVAQALIAAVGRPLAAPSANRSGTISPTTADHVRKSLGDRVDHIIGGGACPVGVESTIVKIDGDRAILLRPGGVARVDIERALGQPLENTVSGSIEAPGMMASHYAPNVKLRLSATEQRENEAFLGFGAIVGGEHTLNLSPASDLREAAGNLFSHLHALDHMAAANGLDTIACAPIPTDGLGEAINDRLQRAAAPRF